MSQLNLKLNKKRIPHNLIVLSDFQEKFIRENFFKLTNPQISEAIGLNLTTTRKHCYRMGFKRMDLEYWSEISIRFLKLYYKKIGDTELAEIFNRHFPKKKNWTKKHIEKKRTYLFLKRNAKEIAEIKQRNIDLGRFSMCAVNMWKSRGVSKIGDIRIWVNHNGVEVAFVKTETGYIPRNRWLWKSIYGDLNANDVIRSIPGAPLIAEIHHLEKITNSENGIRNKALPRSIIKTMFKIKDNALAQQIANDYPEIVELKRKMLNVKNKLNEHNRKINGTAN